MIELRIDFKNIKTKKDALGVLDELSSEGIKKCIKKLSFKNLNTFYKEIEVLRYIVNTLDFLEAKEEAFLYNNGEFICTATGELLYVNKDEYRKKEDF